MVSRPCLPSYSWVVELADTACKECNGCVFTLGTQTHSF